MKQAKYILGVALIVFGMAIVLYPVCTKWRADKVQKELIDKFSENNNISEPKVEPTQEKTALDSLEKLELEEDENSNILEGSEKLLEQQEVIGLIEIPKLEITFAIVEGTERYNLSVAIGHMKKTTGLGQKGNCVLAGHCGGIYGTFFKEIHRLASGDIICITDRDKVKYRYEVCKQFVVEPSDVSVIQNMTEGCTLTLITCENHGTMRRIVQCQLR